MNIKRIFTDMDGTLLDNRGQVTDSNAQLIQEAGIPVTLVSARAPMEMMPAVNKLGLTGTQVGFNGGLIYRVEGGQVIPLRTEVIKREQAQFLLQSIRRYFPQVSLSYYDLNHWYCDRIDEGIDYEASLTGQQPTLMDSQDDFLQARFNTFKIMMITFDEEVMRELEKYLQSLEHEGVSIQRSGKAYLEITSQKAKKSRGISHILQQEGLSPQETAAFGDGHNDLPMLEMVGYPIVMDNAFADIKKIAYQVTTSNEEDGVGYGIHHFLKGS